MDKQKVLTKHGKGHIKFIDDTTYDITIYIIQLVAGGTIAITRGEFNYE